MLNEILNLDHFSLLFIQIILLPSYYFQIHQYLLNNIQLGLLYHLDNLIQNFIKINQMLFFILHFNLSILSLIINQPSYSLLLDYLILQLFHNIKQLVIHLPYQQYHFHNKKLYLSRLLINFLQQLFHNNFQQLYIFLNHQTQALINFLLYNLHNKVHLDFIYLQILNNVNVLQYNLFSHLYL